jgi:hypothetical protein
VYLTQLSERILEQIRNNEGDQMAAIDDVNTAVASLKDAITVALNDLASKADAGSLSGADVRTVIGTLNAEHDAVLAAVSAVDNPPAPTTDPTTAPTGDGSTPTTGDGSAPTGDGGSTPTGDGSTPTA